MPGSPSPPPPPPFPGSHHDRLVGTVGGCADLHHDVWMHCACGHARLMRMDRMAELLKREFSIADFSRRYRCHMCQGVGTAMVTVEPRDTGGVR